MYAARRELAKNALCMLRNQGASRVRSLTTTAYRTGACAEVATKQTVQKPWATALSFAATGLAAATAVAATSTTALCAPATAVAEPAAKVASSTATSTKPVVVFVLGGPGAGKGTQCANLIRDYGFEHLSAGDLLRAHVKSGTKEGNVVAEMIKNGQIVPSEVTVGLLQEAMKASGKEKFLIDGFPRNDENRGAFERVMGYDCEFVLFFDCPEDVMEKRLLGRNEGRTDDNIETIRKRFKVFVESSMPVVQYYEGLGKVRRVVADRDVNEVYEVTKTFFNQYLEE
uniref:UMP-CMP kinase n=1 Tax=Pyramimonas obovata TaxID=1411642 RepID=A0A7S0WVZ6_9CHLO